MKLSDLPDGLHPDIPASTYHERVPGLVSRGGLEKFARAPAVYKAWLDGAKEDTSPALEFGSAFHCALLEPAVFTRSYVVEPYFGDCRYKEAKTTRDSWRREHAGKRTLSADDDDRIRGMCASVRAHPFGGKIMADGVAELTALWTDEATGLRCKARADWYVSSRRLLVDVKTTEDARPEAFERSTAKYGYHRQRAFYGDGFEACGATIEYFVFLAIEKSPPYLVSLYVLDGDATSRGRMANLTAMRAMADCIRLNIFPGYPSSIQTLSLPAWAT